MNSGLERFKLLLSEYRGLAAWVVAGSAGATFVAYFLSIMPPYPEGVAVLTGIVQLLTLVLVFHFFDGVSKKRVSRHLRVLSLCLPLTFILYFIALEILVVKVNLPSGSYVVGFECTAKSLEVFADGCPLPGSSGLAKVIEGSAFSLDEIWTLRSIVASRIILLALWLAFFVLLSSLFSVFLVYNIGRDARR